jgi:hypothetical protein
LWGLLHKLENPFKTQSSTLCWFVGLVIIWCSVLLKKQQIGCTFNEDLDPQNVKETVCCESVSFADLVLRF